MTCDQCDAGRSVVGCACDHGDQCEVAEHRGASVLRDRRGGQAAVHQAHREAAVARVHERGARALQARPARGGAHPHRGGAVLPRNKTQRKIIQMGEVLLFSRSFSSLYLIDHCRALEIAVKYSAHVDLVIGLRQRYLLQWNKKETSPKFLKYSSVFNENFV